MLLNFILVNRINRRFIHLHCMCNEKKMSHGHWKMMIYINIFCHWRNLLIIAVLQQLKFAPVLIANRHHLYTYYRTWEFHFVWKKQSQKRRTATCVDFTGNADFYLPRSSPNLTLCQLLAAKLDYQPIACRYCGAKSKIFGGNLRLWHLLRQFCEVMA